jgi:hypothetical protein
MWMDCKGVWNLTMIFNSGFRSSAIESIRLLSRYIDSVFDAKQWWCRSSDQHSGATPCGCPLFGQAQGPAPTSPGAPYNLNLSVKNFKSWNKTAIKLKTILGYFSLPQLFAML